MFKVLLFTLILSLVPPIRNEDHFEIECSSYQKLLWPYIYELEKNYLGMNKAHYSVRINSKFFNFYISVLKLQSQ